MPLTPPPKTTQEFGCLVVRVKEIGLTDAVPVVVAPTANTPEYSTTLQEPLVVVPETVKVKEVAPDLTLKVQAIPVWRVVELAITIGA